MFMPVLNWSLAEKLHSVQMFANGYKLSDIRTSDFLIDYSSFTAELLDSFTAKELANQKIVEWRFRFESDGSNPHVA